jgi:hypothetical protein
MGRPRILCPVHKENTPSCIIYGETYKCFGCGAHGLVKDLKEVQYVPEISNAFVEDLEAAVAEIKKLPVECVRSLPLHCDRDSYYILWPEGDYYKRRFRNPEPRTPKYLGPAGHAKPVFRLRPIRPSSVAVVVEGELNALSLQAACPDLEIVCPGSASDFASGTFAKTAPSLREFKRLVIMTDKDKAGVKAAIVGKAMLNQYVHDVRVVLMEEDANEILERLGVDALRSFIREHL